jgi:uncharacterized protein with FMN-binding domain
MITFLKVVSAVFIVLILIGAGGIFYLNRGVKAGLTVETGTVDLSSISDGTYSGEYSSGRWSNEVNVTVKDHKITSIEVVDDVTFSKPECTKELINRVIQKQNIDVDVVTGATVTSKAY